MTDSTSKARTERKRPKHPPRSLPDILKQLHDSGFCTQPHMITDECYMCSPVVSWRLLAKQASLISNGNWYARNDGIRWENGNRYGYAKAQGSLTEILRLRELVHTITGDYPRYSSGSCASQLLKWSFSCAEPEPRDLEFLNGSYIGYHECTPGEYPYAIYYDITSCYYQLIKRLESPRLYLNDKNVVKYKPLRPDEKSRWRDILELVESEKLLRNSIWGVMLGSTSHGVHFHDGKEVINKSYTGHSYAAAALVGRTAWELCRAAAVDTSAVYAQTDCVIVPSGTVPNYWDRHGISYGVKSAGEAHVAGQHRYRVGGVQTKFYSRETLFHDANPRPAAPDIQFHFQWL